MKSPEDIASSYHPVGVDSQQSKVGIEETEVDLVSMAYIDGRIYEYGRKLDRWKELDSQSVAMALEDKDAAEMVKCFRRLQNVLNGYNDLRTRLVQAQKAFVAPDISRETLTELQKEDIAFLEDSCGRLLAASGQIQAAWSRREAGADQGQLEILISSHAANREYEEVVKVWSRIPQSQLEGVRLQTKIHYAEALTHLRQQEKAAEIYQQVVEQMSNSNEQANDLISLRRVLADLYIASGKYQAAEKEYKNISSDYQRIGRNEEWSRVQLSLLDRSMNDGPELAEYSSLLRNFLGFLPDQDGYKIVWQAEKFQAAYPYSPVAPNVDFVKESAQTGADRWFTGLIAEVDRLGAEKKFTEALELLQTVPRDGISNDKQLLVEEKNEALLLSEAVEKETSRMVLVQDLQNQWNNGLLLEKDGRYDEAIAVYTSMLGSEYSGKAEEKIRSLSLEAAKTDRREAAELFVRYTKTTDLESKKKLLIESRKLLKNILVKYPDVEIRDKVIGNIKRVEQEMNGIDPNLVLLADQLENQATGSENGTDNVFMAPADGPQRRQTTVIETNVGLPANQ